MNLWWIFSNNFNGFEMDKTLLFYNFRYGMLLRSTCIENLFLAESKCNRYKSTIRRSFIRVRCWYNCPCLPYYLLYCWCILFPEINSWHKFVYLNEKSMEMNLQDFWRSKSKKILIVLFFRKFHKLQSISFSEFLKHIELL